MKELTLSLLLVGVTGWSVAQEIETDTVVVGGDVVATSHLSIDEAESKAASADCSLGVVYDDGGFGDAYAVGPGNARVVMRFNLPAGTTSLDQVCICLTRNAGAPSSTPFSVVVYDNNGPGGAPGTFLGSATANANSLPVFPAVDFYNVNTSGAGITLPDTTVYIGADWDAIHAGGAIFMCGDRSTTTTQRTSFASGDGGGSFTNMNTLFPTSPPRAMGIRTDPGTQTAGCVPDATTLCLNNNRFRVRATFETSGGASGQAQVVELTSDTGYFWFFDDDNVEMVLKILNACPFNSRFWVFAGGLTDVETVITVTDTQSGAVKTYTNPLGTPFQPIQDTSAFATCP